MHSPLHQLRTVMCKLRTLLSKLHKDNYADLRTQEELAKEELTRLQLILHDDPLNSFHIQAEQEAKQKYISILTSSLALMKQQSKMEWISYGDDNTRTFFARAKQRKMSSYIYQINDDKGVTVEGFDKVGQSMMSYYNALLGKQSSTRQCIDQDVIRQGPILNRDQ